jgi:hypothetical protein
MTAAAWVYERAWGKPKEYDPASEMAAGPEFNPRNYSPEQLDVIEAALRLLLNPPKRQSRARGRRGPPVRALDLGLQPADRLSERVLSGRQQLAGARIGLGPFRRTDC